MKAIITHWDTKSNDWTIQNSHIVSHLNTIKGIHKWVHKYVCGKAKDILPHLSTDKHKIEFFTNEGIYGQPFRVDIIGH